MLLWQTVQEHLAVLQSFSLAIVLGAHTVKWSVLPNIWIMENPRIRKDVGCRGGLTLDWGGKSDMGASRVWALAALGSRLASNTAGQTGWEQCCMVGQRILSLLTGPHANVKCHSSMLKVSS